MNFMLVDSQSSNIFLLRCTSELVVIHFIRQSQYEHEQYQASAHYHAFDILRLFLWMFLTSSQETVHFDKASQERIQGKF